MQEQHAIQSLKLFKQLYSSFKQLTAKYCKLGRMDLGSASAERVGQKEVGGVSRRVLCTWWLLGFTVKRPWLGAGGPPLALHDCLE